MKSAPAFQILNEVDSTNNYAMASIHAGLATHGMAWFALDQFAGKGQRGKSWQSTPGANIILSIAFRPPAQFWPFPFLFNALISNACHQFLEKILPGEVRIKWPNDLFIRDRKAGGILIENKYQGKAWNWAVVGIGINVNQEDFGTELSQATSLKSLTGTAFDSIFLAKELQLSLLEAIDKSQLANLEEVLSEYNRFLFKRGEQVRLRQNNIVFETRIEEVDRFGKLHTSNSIPQIFDFGEVQWVL